MRQKYLVLKKNLVVIPLNTENLTLPKFALCCSAWDYDAIVKDYNKLQFCSSMSIYNFIYGMQTAKIIRYPTTDGI